MWSPGAPVDVFHQNCHEIDSPSLSAQRDRWLHMLTVCVLSARASSTKPYLLCMTTNKDFSGGAAAPVTKRGSSCSFRLSSNDQLPRDNHSAFETAVFFSLPLPF